MNIQDFNSPQKIVPCKNPIKNHWVIAIDVGFSSVKAMSPNKHFCFPSFVKKIDEMLMDSSDEDIYYRDRDGLYIVGSKAQDLVRSGDTNDTNSSFDRDRYYTKDFEILMKTAIAIGLMDTKERKIAPPYKPYIVTGLPAAYLKEDSPKIKGVIENRDAYEVKIGREKWIRYENNFKSQDVGVMSQPFGTLASIMYDDNGNPRPSAKKFQRVIIADYGFGTFDPFGIINGKKEVEESINDIGMKAILEKVSSYIYEEFKVDTRIPQLRKYMKDGFINIINVQKLSSKKVSLDKYVERASDEVFELALQELLKQAKYFNDYDYLVITGGTGAAWFDKFKERLKAFESVEILKGNDGNSLPVYMANVRGYYMSSYRRGGQNGRS